MEKKKILIVEDEDEMRKMLVLELETSGYEIFQASDGEEGYKKATETVPDLIISDVLMPKVDGNQLLKMLRNNPLTEHIPFLVLTAREKMRDYFETVDVECFLSKPFQAEELLDRVEKLVKRSHVPHTASTKNVLVAGNDSDTTGSIIVQLEEIGCATDFATSGAQVISKVVTFLPQVLILDVLLEDMVSHELIKILRQMPQTRTIPIVTFNFYSLSELGTVDGRQKALNVDRAESACLAAGATKYIGRYNENNFINTIHEFVS